MIVKTLPKWSYYTETYYSLSSFLSNQTSSMVKPFLWPDIWQALILKNYMQAWCFVERVIFLLLEPSLLALEGDCSLSLKAWLDRRPLPWKISTQSWTRWRNILLVRYSWILHWKQKCVIHLSGLKFYLVSLPESCLSFSSLSFFSLCFQPKMLQLTYQKSCVIQLRPNWKAKFWEHLAVR